MDKSTLESWSQVLHRDPSRLRDTLLFLDLQHAKYDWGLRYLKDIGTEFLDNHVTIDSRLGLKKLQIPVEDFKEVSEDILEELEPMYQSTMTELACLPAIPPQLDFWGQVFDTYEKHSFEPLYNLGVSSNGHRQAQRPYDITLLPAEPATINTGGMLLADSLAARYLFDDVPANELTKVMSRTIIYKPNLKIQRAWPLRQVANEILNAQGDLTLPEGAATTLTSKQASQMYQTMRKFLVDMLTKTGAWGIPSRHAKFFSDEESNWIKNNHGLAGRTTHYIKNDFQCPKRMLDYAALRSRFRL